MINEQRKLIFKLAMVCVVLAGFFSYRYFDNFFQQVGQRIEQRDNLKVKEKLVDNFKDSYSETAKETGRVVEFDLLASQSEIELIDGIKTAVWNYNGQVPGPEIRILLGDRLKINFTNDLPQETTIHFHGVRVPNAMDGVPGVTQDPIKPGEKFVYEFVPKDAGTFWFHPHSRTAEQMERGLYGVLIVEDPKEDFYDTDQMVVVDDWRLTKEGQIDPRFVTRHDLGHDGRWGSLITVNSQSKKSISLQPGSRNRLRFLNTSNARVYKLDFSLLDAQVIAVDGMKVKETFSADNFELPSGSRLDVDIKVPESSGEETFYIQDIYTRNRNNLLEIKISSDVIQRQAESVEEIKYPVADYFPDWSEAINLPADKTYVLNARRGGQYGLEWTINDKAYPNYDPITLKAGQFNKIRFENASGRIHPMHLHGQFFMVLSRNGVAVNEPYWRDTVLVHSKETVEIGLVPLDKGEWVSHCHILEHAEAGMMTVVKVE